MNDVMANHAGRAGTLVDNNIAQPQADEPAAVVTSSEVVASFPCSVAQERFWLLDRLEPGSPAYNVAVRWKLEGRVSTDLLEQAWLKIIERHEILRTVFEEVDGKPMQRVLSKCNFRLPEINLSALPKESQSLEGDRIGVTEARIPFDLNNGPLLRATLLRFSPTTAIILVTTHQIVSDGWSIGIMAREMGIIYEALCRNAEPELEELAIQYADYSQWQLEWLKARGSDAETSYWTKQLAGVKPFSVIPDLPEPAIPTNNGEICSLVLPRKLTNDAQSLSAANGATLFASALAALCTTLSRYTGKKEIVLGTQVSDRDQVELEIMIGQFVNSLILRNDLSGDPRFDELIGRVRETSSQALEHRHIPIEHLLGMVKAERSNTQDSPISVNFIFQKTFIQNTKYGELQLTDMPSLPAGAIYDLNFFMVERPDGWRFSCQYNTDQFERGTVERLLNSFQSVLESAIAEPQRRISELNIVDTNASRLLWKKINDTHCQQVVELTVDQLIDAQVKRSPDSLAVVCDGSHLTYAQLNAKANSLADTLMSHGVQAGARVAVCVDRSINLLVAYLATWKAGAAYVPIDLNNPVEFNIELIKSSGATAVIQLHEKLPEAIQSLNLVAIDLNSNKNTATASPRKLLNRTAATSEACVLFAANQNTLAQRNSVTHGALVTLLQSLIVSPGIQPTDVLLGTMSPLLAMSTIELFLPLLVGARVVMPTVKDLSDSHRLSRLVQSSAATIVMTTAETWSDLINKGWPSSLKLKMLSADGPLNQELAGRLISRGSELWTLYGSAEAGVCAALSRVTNTQVAQCVGKPIANTQLYVLDEKLNTTPIGVVGELYIGTAEDVSRDENSSDNVPDSNQASSMPERNLYRTGYVARLRADLQIELLARTDRHFQIYGFQVAPELIEAALLKDARVADAAVTSELTQSGRKVIHAHVELRHKQNDSSDHLLSELAAALKKYLPEYMLPSITKVEAMPRLRDGSIDYRALQIVPATERSSESLPPPSAELEKKLTAIWCSMLKLPEIDPTANFFELGGHSLLAARMLTRIEMEFGRRINLASLFRAPSISELARLLEQKDSRSFDFRQVVKIRPNGSGTPLIAINNTGTYFVLAKQLTSDRPFISLQLFDPSSLDRNSMPKSLEEIAAGYVDLIRRVQPTGPYSLLGWCVAGTLSFEIARQLEAAKQDVQDLILVDTWVPNYLKRLPKMRGVIGEYTLRMALFIHDCRKLAAGKLSQAEFFKNRKTLKKLSRLFALPTSTTLESELRQEQPDSVEHYDEWLLDYLQEAATRYEPKLYDGKIKLFRSREEPTGCFFDPHAGWDAFTSKGVDLYMVDGDHYTVFQNPGASQIAARISTQTSS